MDKLGIGRRMERLVMAHLEEDGWSCWQPARSKYASQDMFGLYDFVAVKPHEPTLLVQVKRYRAKELAVARDAIEGWCDAFQCPVMAALVHWRRTRSGVVFVPWYYTLRGWEPGVPWSV